LSFVIHSVFFFPLKLCMSHDLLGARLPPLCPLFFPVRGVLIGSIYILSLFVFLFFPSLGVPCSQRLSMINMAFLLQFYNRFIGYSN
jgi:hypothetical protein